MWLGQSSWVGGSCNKESRIILQSPRCPFPLSVLLNENYFRFYNFTPFKYRVEMQKPSKYRCNEKLERKWRF